MTHARTARILLALPIAITVATPALAKGQKGWATASDIGAYSLIAASVGIPLVRDDKQGALQAVGSFAATSLVTEGLKQAFPKLRPDGSDRKSFPSGHTSRSFAAAATIFNREGKSLGIPAFVVASFVGVARVKGDKHFWSDVLVGAAIGTASGFIITRERPDEKSAMIMPWGDTQGGGISFAMRF
jgi:membrane-associated phospholipid phosphatase